MAEPASLLEHIRFGYGPKASDVLAAGGVDPARVLAQLTAADPLGAAWTRPGMAARYVLLDQVAEDKAAGNRGKDSTSYVGKAVQAEDVESFGARPAASDAGFVERLVNAFANRLTISDASGGVRGLGPPLTPGLGGHAGARAGRRDSAARAGYRAVPSARRPG